jgi:PleD family two-component response regulator
MVARPKMVIDYHQQHHFLRTFLMAAVPVRIVVVDDSQVYRRALCGVLQKTGGLQVVAEAENGLVAIQAVENHRPDVVLMDVSMPVLNGAVKGCGYHPVVRILDRFKGFWAVKKKPSGDLTPKA